MLKAGILISLGFFASSLHANSSFNSNNYSVTFECENEESHVSFDDSEGFSLESAYMMLNATDLSYLNEKESSEALESWGFANYDHIRENNKKKPSNGFVAESDEFTLVVLRGTANIGDGLMDIFFAPIEPKDEAFEGKYHRGFLRIYKKRIIAIKEILNRLNISKDKKMIVSGHSMGAAVASLVAHKLYSEGYNVHSIYALSMPRVGNAEANDFLAKDDYLKYQFSHKKDFVSHLPMTPDTVDMFERIGDKVGYKLNEAATSIIPNIDFRHYPADMFFEYDETGIYEIEQDSLVQHEVDFWDDLGERMLDMTVKEWPGIVFENTAYHNNEANICNLRKLIAN